jgi:hypothetical protein
MMNFSTFFFTTTNTNTNAHSRVKQLVPLKNNIVIPVTRPIIKNTGYKPIETSKSKLFHDQMIEICRKNNIQPTYDNNLIGSATGIGDILLKFASIKFKTTDCTRFNFNLEWFTRPYYRMNPINQLEFRLKLIRELCECNNIPNHMVKFIYSKNPNVHAYKNMLLNNNVHHFNAVEDCFNYITNGLNKQIIAPI